MSSRLPLEVFHAIWPITDTTLAFHELRAEGEGLLPELLRMHRLEQVGRPRWSVRPGSDVPGSGGAHTVLLAVVPVVQIPRDVDAITGQADLTNQLREAS